MAADDRGGSRRLREAERRLRAQNRDGHGALQRLRRADDAAGRADVGVRQAGRGRHARLREHVRYDRHGRLLSGDGEKAGEPQPDSKRKVLPERVPAQKADGAQGARRREGAAQKRPRQRAAGDVRFADLRRRGAGQRMGLVQRQPVCDSRHGRNVSDDRRGGLRADRRQRRKEADQGFAEGMIPGACACTAHGAERKEKWHHP